MTSQRGMIPTIRRCNLLFLDGVPLSLREKYRRDIIRFAQGIISETSLDVGQCYSLQGEIYGGDYRDGHLVITHLIKRLTRVSADKPVGLVAEPGKVVLVATTDHGEEYCFTVERPPALS